MSTTDLASLSPAATRLILRISLLAEDSTRRVPYGAIAETSADTDRIGALVRDLDRAGLVDVDEGGVLVLARGWSVVNALVPDDAPLFCEACCICGGPTTEGPCSEPCLAIALEEIHGDYLSERDREDARVAS